MMIARVLHVDNAAAKPLINSGCRRRNRRRGLRQRSGIDSIGSPAHENVQNKFDCGHFRGVRWADRRQRCSNRWRRARIQG